MRTTHRRIGKTIRNSIRNNSMPKNMNTIESIINSSMYGIVRVTMWTKYCV